MSTLSHFLKPEVFATLDDRELKMLAAIIDNEIVSHPDIKAKLEARLANYLPHLTSQRGKKP